MKCETVYYGYITVMRKSLTHIFVIYLPDKEIACILYTVTHVQHVGLLKPTAMLSEALTYCVFTTNVQQQACYLTMSFKNTITIFFREDVHFNDSGMDSKFLVRIIRVYSNFESHNQVFSQVSENMVLKPHYKSSIPVIGGFVM